MNSHGLERLAQLRKARDAIDRDFAQRVRASGAEVLQEPIDQQWGPRDCAFRNPSGNTVRISQAQPANIP